jgi:long-subunit acyl-CoA synthetase (AMP-forming)
MSRIKLSVLRLGLCGQGIVPQNLSICSELQSLVNRMANVLTHVCGVRPLDRCVLYMPVGPTAVAAMLACARIGAVHSVVFAGFSAQALSQRIQDGKQNLLKTSMKSTCIVQLKRPLSSPPINWCAVVV